MKTDLQGRVIVAPHDVRGSVLSANVTLTTGTAATLLAGDADYFLDIIEITFSTASTAAASGLAGQIDLINDGTVVRTFGVPGGSSQTFFDVPLKQVTKNTPWIVDMSDISNTTVWIGATFIKKDNVYN